MGDVFLAIRGPAGLDKLCVIKRMMPDARADQTLQARFRREADITRRLSHGAIAQTLAVEEIAGEPFLVQEFIHGRNLTQVLAAGLSAAAPFPRHLAIHIVREVARALAHAHRLGIVHRDVAPDNIMLSFAGEVKLIDFGIARGLADPALTAPGQLIGRQTYLAPELLAGAPVEECSDIYSLGVVLWQLLARRMPTLLELEADPPPPTSLVPDPEPALDAAALRALARDPSTRFQSADELIAALGAFLPSTFVGESALSAFLSHLYDVPREQHCLDEDTAEARSHLTATPVLISTPEPDDTIARPSSRRRWVALTAVIGVATLILILRHLHPIDAGPHETTAAAPATIPAPPSVAPAPPSPHPAGPTSAETTPERHLPASPAPTPPRPPRLTPSAPARLLRSASDSFDSGDLSGARVAARAALGRGTNLQKAQAHVLLGQVLAADGSREAAKREFEAALRLDAGNVSAAERLAALRRTGRSP